MVHWRVAWFASMVLAVALAGCSASSPSAASPPTPEPTSRPDGASPTAAFTLAPPTVSPTGGAVATPAPLLGALEPSAIDAVIELRVEIHGDDFRMGRTPTLAVYRDGTVLRATDAGPRITRLTADGLARLKAAAAEDGLLDSSGSIKPDPSYNAGFTSYVIELRRGDELIRRATPNALASADKAAGEALIARAEELVDLDSWLPADAWVVDLAHAQLYVPANLLLKITIFDNPIEAPPGATRPPMVDVADVAWPLAGDLPGFGVALAEPPLGNGSIGRCAPVSLADAALVQSALIEAPWEQPAIPTSDRMAALLTWDSQHSHAYVSLANLLPDDALDCSLDGSWP